jgi:hypothetical protein
MKPMNNETLGQILAGILEEKRIAPERLSDLTNISPRYVRALLDDEEKLLPAMPYVRGYLVKIAEALSEDSQRLIDAYLEMELARSGAKDTLPLNRFAINKSAPGRLKIILGGLAIVVFAFWLYNFLGIPKIEINLPETTVTAKNPFFIIQGTTGPKETIYINGEKIYVTRDGFFSKEVLLESGLNVFEIKTKRFLGRETKTTREVIYEKNENRGE